MVDDLNASGLNALHVAWEACHFGRRVGGDAKPLALCVGQLESTHTPPRRGGQLPGRWRQRELNVLDSMANRHRGPVEALYDGSMSCSFPSAANQRQSTPPCGGSGS
jgi:hypothetical protein